MKVSFYNNPCLIPKQKADFSKPSFGSKCHANKSGDEETLQYLNGLGTINSFCVQNKSLKSRSLPDCLKQKPENFFIRIEGYGQDKKWAENMVEITTKASNMILDKKSFEEVMETIANDYSELEFRRAKDTADLEKATRTGVLRLKTGEALSTPFELKGQKYSTYGERYSKKAIERSKGYVIKQYLVKEPQGFEGAATTQIFYSVGPQEGKLAHSIRGTDCSFNYCKEIYNGLIENYADKNLTKKDIKEINKQIASMHWLMAHAVFYERGSDGITNAFIKSLYASLGFKTSPVKQGVGIDLEAFCTEHKDFIRKYTDFYETPPEYIKPKDRI